MCCESSGRVSDREHFVFSATKILLRCMVGYWCRVGLQGEDVGCVGWWILLVILQSIMFCVFLQADSGSEFAFQGIYIPLLLPHQTQLAVVCLVTVFLMHAGLAVGFKVEITVAVSH